MGFIDLGKDLNDVKEPSTVPEGMYDLVIASVKEKDKDGKKGILVIITHESNLDAANILHNISLPGPGDDEEKVENKLRFIKRFVEKFHIPVPKGQLDLTLFPGATGKCKVVLEEYNGVVSNKLKL